METNQCTSKPTRRMLDNILLEQLQRLCKWLINVKTRNVNQQSRKLADSKRHNNIYTFQRSHNHSASFPHLFFAIGKPQTAGAFKKKLTIKI